MEEQNRQNKKRKRLLIIGPLVLLIVLIGVTYAFFNYTRTGSANVIKTGRISFTTTQNGTLNLTNVFPVASNSMGNNSAENTLRIAITGDTTYGDGIEYLVTAEDVHAETSAGKKVPLSLKVAVTDDLGTEDTDYDEINYFIDRESKDTSYYRLLSEGVLYDGQYLLVGYIVPGAEGVNGTITIKAFLDETKVAISDTYPEGEVSHIEGEEPNIETIIDGYNGTSSEWVHNRVVLTTSEWNSLNEQGHELSFKVRVEANQGIWVDPAIPNNSAGSIPASLKENITEIYFIKETPMRMQKRYEAASVKADMTNQTLNEGKVLGWQEGNRLYIASSGETYLPQNSAAYFAGLSNVEKIEFENINTSRVTNMASMFAGSGITSIDMNNLNLSNVTIMSGMFASCNNLTSLDMSNLNTSNVINMSAMFAGDIGLTSVNLNNLGNNNLQTVGGLFNGCINLREVNMSGFNFGYSNLSESSKGLFEGLASLTVINLEDSNMGNVSNMNYAFKDCTSLTSIDLSGSGGNNISSSYQPFNGCTNLREINMTRFNFGSADINGFFSDLTSLDTIYLVDANINNVTNLSGLFYNSGNLTTIYVSSGTDWSSLPSSMTSGMFNYCSSLVGGQGTTYDESNPKDSSYAHIDGGQGNPGYFTEKTN